MPNLGNDIIQSSSQMTFAVFWPWRKPMIEIYVEFQQICQEIKDRGSVVEVWKNGELECIGRVGHAAFGRFVVKSGNGPFPVDWGGSAIRTKFKDGWEIKTVAGDVWLLKECRNLAA